jgi:hypothetical protein
MHRHLWAIGGPYRRRFALSGFKVRKVSECGG